MKTNCCELLLSSLLAFAIITNALLGGAVASDPVLDLAGEQMQVTHSYFIETPPRPSFAASLVGGENETCPLDVTLQFGLPIPARILPVNSDDGMVRESTDLNIKFYLAPRPQCARSGVWNVQYDEESEEYFVRVGGVEGNPGCETITNWFKIEKFGNHYKLVFCPSACKNHYCNAICKDVGVDSQGRFVLSDTPYRFVFRKFHFPKSMISY